MSSHVFYLPKDLAAFTSSLTARTMHLLAVSGKYGTPKGKSWLWRTLFWWLLYDPKTRCIGYYKGFMQPFIVITNFSHCLMLRNRAKCQEITTLIWTFFFGWAPEPTRSRPFPYKLSPHFINSWPSVWVQKYVARFFPYVITPQIC